MDLIRVVTVTTTANIPTPEAGGIMLAVVDNVLWGRSSDSKLFQIGGENKPTTINCIGNPNYPIAVKGQVFVVGTAGKIGGVAGIDVDTKDRIICITDSPVEDIETKVGVNFYIYQGNITAADIIALADVEVNGVIGDVAIAGKVSTIGPDKITGAMIKNAEINESKLAPPASIGLGVLRTAKAQYNFSDGAGPGTIVPVFTANIPSKAIIIGGVINSTTAATSAGAATISVGTSEGSGADSILGATAVASFAANAMINSVATFAAPVKMSLAGNITLTIATAALTAGSIEITVLYIMAIN